ncbi:hypothetical protein N7470_002294 [Penicillium chermesinum]|nr:hypothetical protein N7470_002294 [Penicillium chermesinum]
MGNGIALQGTKSGIDENAHCTPVTFPTFAIHTEPPKMQTQQPTQIFGPASSPFMPSHAASQMSPGSPSPSTRGKYADRFAAQIANPMKSSASLARSKTRKMFLNRVKDERDSSRFEARGEQMMRLDYLAEKRRWEESMARDMDVVRDVDIEEGGMIPDEADLRALDEYTSQEQAMENAILETMGHAETNSSFGDDEYDDLFMALQNQQGTGQSQDIDMS